MIPLETDCVRVQGSHLRRAVSRLQQDLVVEGLPLRVVAHGNGELAQAGHQVLCHSELVNLLSPKHVLQLENNVYYYYQHSL